MREEGLLQPAIVTELRHASVITLLRPRRDDDIYRSIIAMMASCLSSRLPHGEKQCLCHFERARRRRAKCLMLMLADFGMGASGGCRPRVPRTMYGTFRDISAVIARIMASYYYAADKQSR